MTATPNDADVDAPRGPVQRGLVLRGVTIRLEGRTLVAIDRIDIAPGTVTAVMGPSGSGKSSLLAWMTGLLEPPLEGEGTISVAGIDLSALPTEARKLGLMQQDAVLFPHLTVLENLLFALPRDRTAASRRSERRALALQALAQVHLHDFAARRPDALSGGERQRVALARTLLAQPRALLLDEPFSRLHQSLRTELRQLVWQLAAQAGLPVLLVTHDPQDVPDGAPVLRLGQTAAPGDAQ
jgi:putative thiamine transport system ATP-binding protein